MYVNITDNETGNKKGSSGTLVHYLEKENRMEKVPELEYWFNQSRQDVQAYEVRSSMDGNRALLKFLFLPKDIDTQMESFV